ncbi:unnamed protein product, partial [Closterium sp. NIES-64]
NCDVVNGQCSKDSVTGVASCVCNSGFLLQPDGKTCNPPVKIEDPAPVRLPAPGTPTTTSSACTPACDPDLSYCELAPIGAVCVCMPGLPIDMVRAIGCI